MWNHLILGLFHGAKELYKWGSEKHADHQATQFGPHGNSRPIYETTQAFTFRVYAVQQHEIESFLNIHMDAVHIQDFLESLRANGRREMANEETLKALRLVSKNPGSVIMVADFRLD
jgi:hypothetical protein